MFESILIFGGTGTIGNIIVDLFKESPEMPIIKIFSNNENEVWESMNRHKTHSNVRHIIGDIRDYDAVFEALKGIDYVFNCAALKHVKFCEQNPLEAVKTNILGLNNILKAAKKRGLLHLFQISTDKAVEPVSVMGATKLIGEKMVLKSKLPATCLRLGNVWNSRGSLKPQIEAYLDKGDKVFISHPDMERYMISQENLREFIKKVFYFRRDLGNSAIIIPKMESRKIIEVINEIIMERGRSLSLVDFVVYGPGEGEKIKEDLIAQSEQNLVFEKDDLYIIEEVI